MRPIRVLFVMPSSAATGGPRVLLNLLEQLERSRFEPFVLLMARGPLTGELERLGVPYWIEEPKVPMKVDALDHGSPASLLRAIASLLASGRTTLALLRRWSIDVVWARNLKGVLLVALPANLTRRALIWDIGLEKPGRGLFGVLNGLGLIAASQVVTEADVQHAQVFGSRLAARFGGRIRTIHPGISEQRVRSIRDAVASPGPDPLDGRAELNILQVGTLCERKNQLLSLQALARLKGESVRLHFVGGADPPDYRRRLESYVADHGLDEMVRFYGWRDDVPRFLAGADLCLMTSVNEGVPYAVQEAMYAFKPVVVSDAGGMAEAVVQGVTGRVIRPNDVDELAAVIREFLDDPALLQAMGHAAGVHAAERFVTSRWYRQYSELLLTCAAARRSAGV